jgi:hypothetical protein
MSGDSQPSSSGRSGVGLPLFNPTGYQPSTTALALTIAGAAVAGAVVWHFSRESYYAYVPPQVPIGVCRH